MTYLILSRAVGSFRVFRGYLWSRFWRTYFSPDSKHVAYIAINGRWQNNSHTEQLVVDGQEGPVVARVDEASLRWSSDGKHLAYVAAGASGNDPFGQGGPKWVILDGLSQARHGLISDLAFSADGKHLAYVAHGASGAAYTVVLDGRPGPMFDEIKWRPLSDRSSLFTPDGRHTLFQARRRGKAVVVLDGQPGPEYDKVLGTWIRLNGSTFADGGRRSTCSPRILPDGAIQYSALIAGNPAELYIVTQWPAAEAATPPGGRP